MPFPLAVERRVICSLVPATGSDRVSQESLTKKECDVSEPNDRDVHPVTNRDLNRAIDYAEAALKAAKAEYDEFLQLSELRVRLPSRLIHAVIERSARDDRTLNATVRRALRLYLDDER